MSMPSELKVMCFFAWNALTLWHGRRIAAQSRFSISIFASFTLHPHESMFSHWLTQLENQDYSMHVSIFVMLVMCADSSTCYLSIKTMTALALPLLLTSFYNFHLLFRDCPINLISLQYLKTGPLNPRVISLISDEVVAYSNNMLLFNCWVALSLYRESSTLYMHGMIPEFAQLLVDWKPFGCF